MKFINFISRILFKFSGWKILGTRPSVKQYILVFAPHTSNFDFYITLLAREVLKMKTKYVAKKELFKAPFGWFFRLLGGIPVDRSKSTNFVDSIVEYYKKLEEFSVIFAAEGTRKYIDSFKTGFYYVSVLSKAPICMVGIDYPTREIHISEPYYPSGDKDIDFKFFIDYYKKFTGKFPELTFLNKK